MPGVTGSTAQTSSLAEPLSDVRVGEGGKPAGAGTVDRAVPSQCMNVGPANHTSSVAAPQTEPYEPFCGVARARPRPRRVLVQDEAVGPDPGVLASDDDLRAARPHGGERSERSQARIEHAPPAAVPVRDRPCLPKRLADEVDVVRSRAPTCSGRPTSVPGTGGRVANVKELPASLQQRAALLADEAPVGAADEERRRKRERRGTSRASAHVPSECRSDRGPPEVVRPDDPRVGGRDAKSIPVRLSVIWSLASVVDEPTAAIAFCAAYHTSAGSNACTPLTSLSLVSVHAPAANANSSLDCSGSLSITEASHARPPAVLRDTGHRLPGTE